jgi:hypothetical protein
MINNNLKTDGKGDFIPSIVKDTNANLQYRCVYDEKVYGTTKEVLEMKNALNPTTSSPYMAGFLKKADATIHQSRGAKSTLTPDYIVKKPENITAGTEELKKYAQFSGAYGGVTNKIIDSTDLYTPKIAKTDYIFADADATAAKTKYVADTPLICNVVYPQVLGVLDKDTKEKNEISCEYAKQCGVSWSSLKCK